MFLNRVKNKSCAYDVGARHGAHQYGTSGSNKLETHEDDVEWRRSRGHLTRHSRVINNVTGVNVFFVHI